ncbi:MAG: VCBS repeat-containing protein [Pirellulales bacterium]
MAVAFLAWPGSAPAGELAFRTQQIADRLGIGYAVALVDVNEDRRPDIVVVDKDRVLWYENPSWQVHTLIQDQTRPDNVCLAPYDVDQDGKVDFALGADWGPLDTRAGGTIQWLSRGRSAGEPWQVYPIGEEPTVHRMRWADLDGDGRSELIVVPLMGRGTTRPLWNERPLRILAYKIPDDPRVGPWQAEVINEDLHVAHNFWPADLDRDGTTEILVASYEGVSLLDRAADGTWSRTLIGEGNQQTMPDRGASEIRHGTLADGSDYIATIEPWHGFQVVVYTRPDQGAGGLWRRTVLDEQLKWGHAVWCADLDGDGDQELIAGVRDDKDDANRRGLRIYDPRTTGPADWKRHLVDAGGVAIEDLAAADLDGDGRIDIVAVGRQTQNVRIYWNQTEASASTPETR